MADGPGKREGPARRTGTVRGEPVVVTRDLHVQFPRSGGAVRAVDGVDLTIDGGEVVGLVGESGCGKSVLALSLLGLVPPPGEVTGGSITVAGQDLAELDEEGLRQLRGQVVSITFQDPMTSLNPVLRVGTQVGEAMTAHDRFPPEEAAQRIVPLLARVDLPTPEVRDTQYPHQLSGGMRQRSTIAMGLANEPALLVADEAST
ncbi:MAG: ATP-binding cassette domain-containing protein, partial [Candidatus Dormibacteria bacterium]